MYYCVSSVRTIAVLYPFFMGGYWLCYHSLIHIKNKHGGRNEQTILRKIRGTNGIGHIVDIKHIKMNWVTVVAE